MTSVYPNFEQAARKNQAYIHDYGTQKSVTDPVWVGAEGDRAAVQRSTYPSQRAREYFSGPLYNQQFANYLTTGTQGRAKNITDRFQLTGMADYSTYGRDSKEYETVSTKGVDSLDMLIGVGILGAAVTFIMLSR